MAHAFLQGAVSGDDLSTYTFASQNFGTASSDRYVAVVVSARATGTVPVLSGVTIGGVTATEAVYLKSIGGGNTTLAAIYIAAVPSGTSGDVDVTFSGTMLRCAITAYALTGITSPTAIATSTRTGSGNFSSFTLSGDAYVIAGGYNGSTGSNDRHTSASLERNAGSPAVGWTQGQASTQWIGVSRDYDTVIESGNAGQSAVVAAAFEASADIASPIEYVGGASLGFAGSTTVGGTVAFSSLTGGLGTTLLEDDLVIVAYNIGSTADLTPSLVTSGYTDITELYVNGSSYDTNLRVWYKFMGSTPDTDVETSPTGFTVSGGAVAVSVWRGVDTATPFDVSFTTDTGTGTTIPNPAAITPSTTGAMIVMAGGGAASSAPVYRSALPYFTTAFINATQDASIGLGAMPWSSGAYDPAVWEGGNVSAGNSWASVTLALKPVSSGYTLALDSGTFTLTGTAVTLRATRSMAAATAAFSLTGTDATLKVGKVLTAASGTFSLTGTDAAFRVGATLAADSGTFTLTGTAATFRRDLRLVASSGSFALAGSTAELTHTELNDYEMTAEPGAFVLTGSPAELVHEGLNEYILEAESGSFVLAGSRVIFRMRVPTVARPFRVSQFTRPAQVQHTRPAQAVHYRGRR